MAADAARAGAAGRAGTAGTAGAGELAGPELVVERVDNVLVARLNRPAARNALSPGLMTDLGMALIGAERDPAIRVLVITGTGERAFCSGMDLKAFAAGAAPDQTSDAIQAFRRLVRGEATVPVIGAANGSAVAGGLELLLGCDLAVIAEGAIVGLPEVKRGLIAGAAVATLATRIPLAAALELLLTGDSVSAERAVAMGLVNRVVAPADVLPTALDLARRVAANAPMALRATRELARLGALDAAAADARLREWIPTIFSSADAREGATAFGERRDPVWVDG